MDYPPTSRANRSLRGQRSRPGAISQWGCAGQTTLQFGHHYLGEGPKEKYLKLLV